MQPLLDVRGVTLQYQAGAKTVTAVYQVSFEAWSGDRFVLLGSSGCGKSTLLKAIGGYLPPAAGEILVEGAPVRSPGPDRMMVFQEFDQLLPWKTVRANVIFALTASRRASGAEARAKADDAIARVNLTRFADAYPHALSGGMKQRVALARALAVAPRILLMDEPFAALDALTRTQMQEELLQLWEGTRFTMVFVTHSIREAITVGSRILVLTAHPGRVRAEVDASLDKEPLLKELLLGARSAEEGAYAE